MEVIEPREIMTGFRVDIGSSGSAELRGVLDDIRHVRARLDRAEAEVAQRRETVNRAQRRALSAIYATCSVPGCNVSFNHTKPHHVRWWRHGGPTNLANLLPPCSHHHHCAHEGGWILMLGPDRQLTIELPEGQIMRTGPPQRMRSA